MPRKSPFRIELSADELAELQLATEEDVYVLAQSDARIDKARQHARDAVAV
jgi:hypothetical protein